ncbi:MULTISPECIES: nuclear transport factor 2 family protein [unclassified Pedobacter]|uniref:nuclear transport factor 2 family protein n=1 Tax=unclassified Pedobacter TaxID=2628915 RepID=UPI001E2F7890|nr:MULTISPECIES: nuclear transport factor 2 family protein [unclassified Pedobacter]
MKSFLTILIVTVTSFAGFAQIDTTSFAKERAEIRTLLRNQKPGTLIDCNDFIAVGPKGDISFSHEQWVEVQKKEKLIFKSVRPIPGNEFIRIYDGTMAVVNLLIEVKLVVDNKDVDIKVRRLEVYHKNAGKWCRVAGQGTQVDENLFPVKG